MPDKADKTDTNQSITDKDHYAEHLADVNQEVDVVATEDILNKNGVLIARKGARIDHAAAKKIIQHKLSKPLEQQVLLSDNLDPGGMYQGWTQLMDKYPDLGSIHRGAGFEKIYQRTITSLKPHPLISQKLTVLSRQLPEWYEKALFCAWLSALLAKELGMDDHFVGAAIVASLNHDVGFLHIQPEILKKKGSLSSDEWKAIQAHVVIGQMFMNTIPDMDERVPGALLEHHERCDGTGYPLGKTGPSLGLLGKIIGLADSLQAIRINQFAATGRTLRDAIPYLQMNDVTHSVEVYRAATALLKKSGLPVSRINPYGGAGMWAQRLMAKCQTIKQVREILVVMQQIFIEALIGKTRAGSVLLAVINNVLTKIASAGLEGDQAIQWLSSCSNGDDNMLAELNETDLIINELIWHCNHVQRTAAGFLDNEQDQHPTLQQSSKETLGKLADLLSQLRK